MREFMMVDHIYRGAFAAVGFLALVGFLFSSDLALAEATTDQHVSEAMTHAKEAAESGKQGNSTVLMKHAKEALKHAQASNVKSEHLDKAIEHLQEAIEHGKAGRGDAATQNADHAIMHMSQIK